MTFDSYFNSGRPQQFYVQPGSLPDKIVAPFWSDIDMTADSRVWYHFYNQFSANSSVLYEAQTLIVQNYKDSMVASSFSPNTALVVTWENVRPAPASVYSSQVKNRLRISQIVLIACKYKYKSVMMCHSQLLVLTSRIVNKPKNTQC